MQDSKHLIFKKIAGQPQINISIFKKQNHIDLKFNSEDFELFDMDGNRLFEGVQSNCSWRVKVKQCTPAQYEYYLILRESENQKSVSRAFAEFKKQQDNVSLHKFGGNVYIEQDKISSNEKHVILAGPFSSERDARHHSNGYGQLNHCRIHRNLISEGSGIVEIFDREYENFAEVNGGLKLLPKNMEAFFEIKRFEIKPTPERKAHHEDISYRGQLTIKIDEESTLSGCNELPVEMYLRGVLYSEIGEHASLEYAKSMAIVARSQIFSRYGLKHRNENFDFCSDSHCLRYYGKKFRDPMIEQAVTETQGIVLGKDTKICDSFFSFSCGGHTENASGVWLNDDFKYATGKFDGANGRSFSLDLTKEKDVKEWIFSRPDVNCKIDSQDLSNSKELSSDSFRWEIFYTRSELEEILFEKTGEEPGIIYEIIPLTRGVSGRIKEIEILGSLKNVRITGELNIRSAFSEQLLNSSCFFVKPEIDDDGVPISFLFVGAGKGHGVGLCKIGAAKLAMNGKNCDAILDHYFERCSTKRIY